MIRILNESAAVHKVESDIRTPHEECLQQQSSTAGGNRVGCCSTLGCDLDAPYAFTVSHWCVAVLHRGGGLFKCKDGSSRIHISSSSRLHLPSSAFETHHQKQLTKDVRADPLRVLL
jgi:hypothetical protein